MEDTTQSGRQASRPTGLTPPSSAMIDRAGPVLRWLGRAFFGAVAFEDTQQQTIRDAAARGAPVYVMNAHSLLDYAYFNYAFRRFGLPLVYFANGVNLLLFRPVGQVLAGLWRRLFTRRRPPQDRDAMAAGLSEGRPCLVFLKRHKALIQWGAEDRLHHLRDVGEIQRGMQRPIVLVPLLLVWEQKPESYRRTFFDMVFGDPQAPGRLRKFVSFALNFRRARVQVGRPIDLWTFLTDNPDAADADTLAARLRFSISNEFLLESKAIRGPTLKGSRRVVDEVARTPPFIEEVRSIAAAEGADPDGYLARARVMLSRMAADYKFNWLEGFAFVLGFVFQRLFKGVRVDTAGLQEIRAAARTAPVVLVPAHRSHIDYLLYSVVLYTHGLIPPHIAAGDNLSFWPMGTIFRRSGAFFIRRSGRGNTLYQAVLRHYVRKLLKEGNWVEFYIEGTRSRSGKSIPPKFGMLSMIVDAVASGAAPGAQLVPAAITYEKVVEERSYRRESAGSEKERESLKGLAASAKVLGSRYGKVYVEFDHPIDLVAFLRAEGVEIPLRPGEEVPREAIRRLAYALMGRINRCLVVTPHHLVAYALLTHPKRGIEREDLLERIGFLLTWVAARGAPLSDELTEPLSGYDLLPAPGTAGGLVPRSDSDETRTEALGWAVRRPVDDVLKIFRKETFVDLRAYGDDWVVSVTEEGRRALDYYKNGVLHLFVPEAIVSCAAERLSVAGRFDMEALGARTAALSRTFKLEFVFGPDEPFDFGFGATAARFVRERLLREVEGGLEVVPAARETMSWFAGALAPFVEAYRVAGRVVAAEGAPGSDKEVVKTALRAGRKALAVGDVVLAESVSTVMFQNAVACMRSEVEAGRATDMRQAARAMLDIL